MKSILLEEKRNHLSFGSYLALPLVLGCMLAVIVTEASTTQAQNYSDWSTPSNLGSAINSAANDQQPAISPDGLSLYFTSNRSGGLGGFDMYVSHRVSVSDPWGAPVNLGAALNTTADDGNAVFSRDGRLLFFQSKRSGGLGGIDIWLSRRNNPQDDFDWQPPVDLSAAVNSSADDSGPAYFEDIARGKRQLYFGSTRSGGLGAADFYVSEQMADDSFGPAALVTELNSSLNENDGSTRHDGLEIIFQSNRTGSISGSSDLWVARRGSTLDAWSTPVNLGGTINTASAEQNAYLSPDGTTCFFSSDRPGGSGGLDLYVSTRAVGSPSWTLTGNLNAGRDSHTATLLPNGKVLVAGGNGSNGPLKSAELYDPATGVWSNTGNLNTAREVHTATLLQNGKVLVAVGHDGSGATTLNSAELYDPDTGTWSSTGNSHVGGGDISTATLLLNGKVLLVAGFLQHAELYDPATGTWSNTGNPTSTGYGHTATLLPNGKVLVAGGDSFGGCGFPLNSAELYDPATGTWSSTGDLNTGREYQTATLLPGGRVLVVGGLDSNYDSISAELYDPATGLWTTTSSLNTIHYSPTATLLTNGMVLLAGGDFGHSAELYDPATGSWSGTANTNLSRNGHAATLLLNGKVLVAGGNGFNAQNSAELYDPAANLIDNTQFFVQQHYVDFLNRQPDPRGFTFWNDNINSCGSDPHCVEVKRIDTSAAFFLSIEFQQTGYLVYRTYKAAYGNLPNAPVPIKFDEFLPDTQQIGQGVIVNQSGWEQVLENNKQAFMAQFVQRSRFSTAFPTSLTPAQFVDALFSNAGVTPSATERAAAINEFGTAATSSDVAARARAVRRVGDSSTLAQQEFNRAFVLMQYFGYLRRNPNDPPEPTLDFSGYNFWLTKLNQFNGSFRDAEMVKAFLVSTEYRQRFGP